MKSRENIRVYIVEDEFIVAENIKLDLMNFGYDVVGMAASGEKAIEEIHAMKPDLVLMDINLKGKLTGLDVARDLKENMNIPIIFLTAYADEKTLDEAKKLGAYGFLVKPFQAIDLKSAIEVAFGKFDSLEKITEEKLQSEQALIDTEQRYKDIIDNVSDLIYTTDRNGFITFVNPAASNLIEYSKEEIIGRNFREFVHEEFRERILEFYRHILKEKEPIIYHEFPVISKSGKEIWVGQNVQMIKDGDKVIGFQAVARDITDRINFETDLIRSKEAAESAARMKTQFIANMSHEIRTPLNGIIGITKLLKKTDLNPKQAKYLKAISASSDQLMGIINNILDISKIEANKVSVDNRIFDFQELMSGIESLFEERADDKKIQFSYELDNYIPRYLTGDSVKLNQILYNLVGNAIKFTDKGSVKVKTFVNSITEDSCNIGIKVIDTGIGIVPEKLETIFSAFTQAEGETTRKYGGTGLGLTIVKRLVNLLGGTINVESEPGKGSTFTVEVPFSIPAQEQITELGEMNEPEELNFDMKGTRILLVEDNKINQIVTSDLLKAQNATVHIANNGVEALEYYKSNDVDLILMDMQMPVMDGYSAMNIIRHEFEEPKSSVPIIALTAHAFEGELQKCKECGASDYLSKPFEPGKLFEKIVRLIRENDPSKKFNKMEDDDISPKAEHLDVDKLRMYVNDNEELVYSTLELLKNTFSEDIKELEELTRTKLRHDIKRVAHRIKPNYEMIGYTKLYNLCLALEETDNIELNIEILHELISKTNKLIREIDMYLNEHLNTIS